MENQKPTKSQYFGMGYVVWKFKLFISTTKEVTFTMSFSPYLPPTFESFGGLVTFVFYCSFAGNCWQRLFGLFNLSWVFGNI